MEDNMFGLAVFVMVSLIILKTLDIITMPYIVLLSPLYVAIIVVGWLCVFK